MASKLNTYRVYGKDAAGDEYSWTMLAESVSIAMYVFTDTLSRDGAVGISVLTVTDVSLKTVLVSN